MPNKNSNTSTIHDRISVVIGWYYRFMETIKCFYSAFFFSNWNFKWIEWYTKWCGACGKKEIVRYVEQLLREQFEWVWTEKIFPFLGSNKQLEIVIVIHKFRYCDIVDARQNNKNNTDNDHQAIKWAEQQQKINQGQKRIESFAWQEPFSILFIWLRFKLQLCGQYIPMCELVEYFAIHHRDDEYNNKRISFVCEQQQQQQ